MRTPRTTAALVVAALALVGLTAQPAQAATPSASVVVAPSGGGIDTSGRPLDVDVTLTNSGDARLPAGRLAFSLGQAPVASATTLVDSIARPDQVLLGYFLTRTSAATPALDPGETRTVRVRVPAADLREALTSANGARLLSARYRAGGLQRVGTSSVVSMAKGFRNSVGFATVVPVLAPANTTGVVDVATQEALAAPGGAWDEALEAARSDPSATVALDPEVIASIRLAGESAPPEATGFLGALDALPNQFVRLPYADGDLSLQRAAGVGAPLEPTSFAGSAVATTSDQDAVTPSPAATPSAGAVPSTEDLTAWDWSTQSVAWPVPGTASSSDVAALGSGDDWVLLPSGDVEDSSARVAAGPAARIGNADVLVADSRVSALLASAGSSGTGGAAALAELSGLLATAAVTGETPAVLAVPGRSADAAGVTRALDLLMRQPWVAGRSLAELAGSRDRVAVRLGRTSVPASRVATARALVAGDRAVRDLGAALQNSAALIGPERLALLGSLSAAWRADDRAWAVQAGTVTQRFAQFLSEVTFAKASPITIAGNDGQLKVPIDNGLDRPVTVRVRASASNSRLQLTGDDAAEIVVPAKASRSAVLQYRAITNGSTEIRMVLETPKGVQIGPSITRDVTVRAGFDTIVAAALLSALAVLLALGVYRNVKRRRQPRRATS